MVSINHGETIRPVSDHKTTEEGKRNAEVLYWEMKWVIWSSTTPPCGRTSAVERSLDWDRRSSIHIVTGKGGKGPGRATMELAFVSVAKLLPG